MEWPSAPRLRISRAMALLQIMFGSLVVLLAVASLHRFNSISIFLHMDGNDVCCQFHAAKNGYTDFDMQALSNCVEEVPTQLAVLQQKLESTVQKIDKDRGLRVQNILCSEFQ